MPLADADCVTFCGDLRVPAGARRGRAGEPASEHDGAGLGRAVRAGLRDPLLGDEVAAVDDHRQDRDRHEDDPEHHHERLARVAAIAGIAAVAVQGRDRGGHRALLQWAVHHGCSGNRRSIGISDVALIEIGPMIEPATGVIGVNWLVTVTVARHPMFRREVHSSVTPGGAA